MAGRFLDANYWRNEFAVTGGDLDRLEALLREAGEPVWATRLLRHVVEHKLARSSDQVDPLERAKSAQAATRFLGEATVYHPTGHYAVGQWLYVARRGQGWQIGCGRVISIDRSDRPPAVALEVPGEPTPWKFVCEVPPGDPSLGKYATPLSERELNADHILRVHSADLLPHLLGRLGQDRRFVNVGDRWWLAGAVRAVPDQDLDRLHLALVSSPVPQAAGDLLPYLGEGWPDTPGQRFSLELCLGKSGRFEYVRGHGAPRWRAVVPAGWVRLGDGTWLDPSLPADILWTRHRALFAGPLPAELRGHPDAVELYGRWLLRPLLIPFDADELELVRDHLARAGEARSDVDILADLGRKPTDDDWPRWQFSLAWALGKAGEMLGIEYVGLPGAWRWALRTAPAIRPERYRPIRGRDGLPVAVQPLATAEVEKELSGGEPDEPEPERGPEPGTWQPSAPDWTYALTYYDWQHGILPYAGGARAIIPPLEDGQDRALFDVVAGQVSDVPFAATLRRHERTPWLHSQGLLELYHGYLVPGARIRLLRTERPDLFKLLYTPAPQQACQVLFFEPGSLRPFIETRTFACEVDPDLLLTESRFSDWTALSELYQEDRRTAPKVLADIFEAIGEYDEGPGIYRAHFRDLFPLLCVTKPYSRSYVQQILARNRAFPWFYPDRERGGDWHCYDLARSREGPRLTRRVRRPATLPPGEPVDFWRSLAGLRRRQLRTLDQEHPFTVLEVGAHRVEIEVGSTGKLRAIERTEIEPAWKRLVGRGELSRAEIRDLCSEYNPAYVAALLAALPGVTHTTSPIVLRYQAAPPQGGANGAASSPAVAMPPPPPAPGALREAVSDTERLHLEFWTQLLEKARRQAAPGAGQRPTLRSDLKFGSGLGSLAYLAYVIREHDCQVGLYIDGGELALNKRTFDQLRAARQAIEAAFGGPLEWQRLDDKRACRIALNMPGGGLLDRRHWPDIQQHLIDAMVRLERALRPHIRQLRG